MKEKVGEDLMGEEVRRSRRGGRSGTGLRGS
jgi:hypothetical protein